MRETDSWPIIPAKWFQKTDRALPYRNVRLIVIHDMEAPEKGTTAEDVARYFAETTRRASAHICVDNNSIVQCVPDRDIAYGAPGANHDGIQIELAGYASQDRAHWLDDYGLALMEKAANATAQYCLKFTIPVQHLTNAELKGGSKGIVGHYQVSAVYKESDHQDPGLGFPWDYFMMRVETHRWQLSHTIQTGLKK